MFTILIMLCFLRVPFHLALVRFEGCAFSMHIASETIFVLATASPLPFLYLFAGWLPAHAHLTWIDCWPMTGNDQVEAWLERRQHVQTVAPPLVFLSVHEEWKPRQSTVSHQRQEEESAQHWQGNGVMYVWLMRCNISLVASSPRFFLVLGKLDVSCLLCLWQTRENCGSHDAVFFNNEKVKVVFASPAFPM